VQADWRVERERGRGVVAAAHVPGGGGGGAESWFLFINVFFLSTRVFFVFHRITTWACWA
jgi:hypothetical protein